MSSIMQITNAQAVQSDEISRDLIRRWVKNQAALSDLCRLYRACRRLASAESITTVRKYQDHRDVEAAQELQDVMRRLEALRRVHKGKNWAKRGTKAA